MRYYAVFIVKGKYFNDIDVRARKDLNFLPDCLRDINFTCCYQIVNKYKYSLGK